MQEKIGPRIRTQAFSRGEHNLDIQITDKAGNAIAENIEFEVEY